MTLDRETARALFGEAPTTAPAGAAPVAAPRPDASLFGDAPATYDRPRTRSAPKSGKGVDWRLAAPVGVAVLCIGAVALFALPRNDPAVEGRTVASADIAPPPVAPPAPLTPAVPEPAATVAPTPAPTVQRVAAAPRPTPAPRRAPVRVAAAPSAADTATDVSATEPTAPPPPSLGEPAAVSLQPATPPAPAPATEPVPQ